MGVVDAGCAGIIKYASFTNKTFFTDGAFLKILLQDLGNAPKGLSSEFQPDSSQKKATSLCSTANGDDPLAAERGKFVVSQLRSLRSLRCDNKFGSKFSITLPPNSYKPTVLF